MQFSRNGFAIIGKNGLKDASRVKVGLQRASKGFKDDALAIVQLWCR
jgi:hypothetical protein